MPTLENMRAPVTSLVVQLRIWSPSHSLSPSLHWSPHDGTTAKPVNTSKTRAAPRARIAMLFTAQDGRRKVRARIARQARA
jgi:hypothetical protein